MDDLETLNTAFALADYAGGQPLQTAIHNHHVGGGVFYGQIRRNPVLAAQYAYVQTRRAAAEVAEIG